MEGVRAQQEVMVSSMCLKKDYPIREERRRCKWRVRTRVLELRTCCYTTTCDY